MDYQNLTFLQDAFFQTQHICSWNMTMNLQLLYTNCPEQEYFFNLFSVSRCPAAITEHFSHSPLPLIATDRIGFVWIATLYPGEEKNALPIIYMLGPVFTSKMTESYFNQHLSNVPLSAETKSRLLHFIKDVPNVTSDTVVCHANMLHYCINKSAIHPTDVTIWSEPVENAEELAWGDTNWHGSWLSEQRLFQSISEGRFEDHSKINTGKIGNIGGGDPLRQAKNEMIVFAVICSRASIIGGVSSEGALNLSDYFVQKIEASNTISEVHNIGAQMQQTYIQRVRRTKASAEYSALIRDCMDFVETHIFEHITLKAISEKFGYTEPYISRKFKYETGDSLIHYINRQKMKIARSILQESNIPIAELSERLSFSSPSYFSLLFKKEFGINPMDFRKGNKNKN